MKEIDVYITEEEDVFKRWECDMPYQAYLDFVQVNEDFFFATMRIGYYLMQGFYKFLSRLTFCDKPILIRCARKEMSEVEKALEWRETQNEYIGSPVKFKIHKA